MSTSSPRSVSTRINGKQRQLLHQQHVHSRKSLSSSSSSSSTTSSRFCRCKKGTLFIAILLGSFAWFLALINILLGKTQPNQPQLEEYWSRIMSIPQNWHPTITRLETFNQTMMMSSVLLQTAVSPQQQQHPQQQQRRKLHKTPTHHACDGFRGIYQIQMGDIGGAAGTIFFQFVVGQIIWAELYGFKPFVHLNNVSYIVYDDSVHGRPEDDIEFDMMTGVSIPYVRRKQGVAKDAYPGPPHVNASSLRPHHFHLRGNGVWDSYFEPVSDFVPGDVSCTNKPLVTMDLYLITPGIHGFAPWSPKCWRYDYMPDYTTLPHLPYQVWLQPQRQRAHAVMKKYIRFQPHLHAMAQQVNPIRSETGKCCGVHIRHSDKVGGRRKVPVEEFLPYLQAYVDAGGTCIYLATDSSHVLTTAQTSWPLDIRSKLRSLGSNVVRSHNETAVFDMAHHHRTNTEILVEILALSQCDFLIHGLSAVSETAIWIHYELHHQSVNLEDPDHMNHVEFQQVVQAVLQRQPPPTPRRMYEEWWKQSRSTLPTPVSVMAQHKNDCSTSQQLQQQQYRGILLIAHAGTNASTGTAFFTTILNQLWYADQHQLLPLIHLEGKTSTRIYDEAAHHNETLVELQVRRGEIQVVHQHEMECPGEPITSSTDTATATSLQLQGDGIWNHYFRPVSNLSPHDACFQHLPLYQLSSPLVVPGLYAHCAGAIRAWRYDEVPASLWHDPANGVSLQEWMYPMRQAAHSLIQKYYKFQPHILAKANEVNPIGNSTASCLAVHVRQSDKDGLYRRKFPPHKFRDYVRAYVRAGGRIIYVATDSRRALEYMANHFPPEVLQVMRTQGKYVVRSTKKWPVFELADHHRINSEALVDILAMSFCNMLLHGYSAMSEAAIYLNPQLHNHSVNLEDPNHISPAQFERLARSVLGTTAESNGEKGESQPLTDLQGDGLASHKTTGSIVTVLTDGDNLASPSAIVMQYAANTTLLLRPGRQCKENAIVYLAQKRHSSYDRDSYGLLLQSLDLLTKNYLANHSNNADLFIFHTGDFDAQDLKTLESRSENTQLFGMLRFVDLSNSQYWRRPPWHVHDNPNDWYAYHLFKEGYRHMMHWFAIGIWDFFDNYNRETGCNYGMIMRFDEDSFLHSPIHYNVFDFMRNQGYVYGYRLCAYELQVTQRMWKIYKTNRRLGGPVREVELEMCGFYNNFFVASLDFFRSTNVQAFLKLTDRKGYIYRRRLGDLMIHSMAVYAFAPEKQIHRFLDFTYEHTTVNQTTGCVVWGGIQAGYQDDRANATLDTFFRDRIVNRGCTANVTTMSTNDLSPSYNHLPDSIRNTLSLKSIMAGNVELPHKGLLSG